MTKAESLAAALRGRVVPALLTPMRSDGSPDLPALRAYAAEVAGRGAGGLAVVAHTGRGPHLSGTDRIAVVRACREAVSVPIVAAVPPTTGTAAEIIEAAARTGQALAGAGADALLVFPPVFPPASAASAARGGDAAVVELHAAVVELHRRAAAQAGVPVLAFALYGRASGHQYPPDLVARLVAVPGVAGVKLALLNDAVACQDTVSAVRAARPTALILSGEDRMLGPSLMWGADSALVGIAAALPEWTVDVLDAWNSHDAAGFLAASRRLDALGRLTFREPMEGYVQRMAWLAAWQGLLPEHVAVDRFGPSQPDGAREELLAAVESLAALTACKTRAASHPW